MDTNVAMYKPQRTEVRPPAILRLPLCWTLSWLSGTTPTKRAICFFDLLLLRSDRADTTPYLYAMMISKSLTAFGDKITV
jgi:hypothetical protein